MPFIVVLPHCAAQEKHGKHQGSINNPSESFRGNVRQVHHVRHVRTLVSPRFFIKIHKSDRQGLTNVRLLYVILHLLDIRDHQNLKFQDFSGATKVCTWRTSPLNDSEELLTLP